MAAAAVSPPAVNTTRRIPVSRPSTSSSGKATRTNATPSSEPVRLGDVHHLLIEGVAASASGDAKGRSPRRVHLGAVAVILQLEAARLRSNPPVPCRRRKGT